LFLLVVACSSFVLLSSFYDGAGFQLGAAGGAN